MRTCDLLQEDHDPRTAGSAESARLVCCHGDMTPVSVDQIDGFGVDRGRHRGGTEGVEDEDNGT